MGSRTYTSNPHNPILTPPIRIIFVTTTMRSTLISACLIGWASASCSVSSPEPKAKASDDKNYMAECITALEGQIVIEFRASLQYLLMAAHFSQDTVNLPKVADLFWRGERQTMTSLERVQSSRSRRLTLGAGWA